MIDVHRHLWPQPLLDALRERDEPPYLRDWNLVLVDGEYAVEPDAYGLRRCLAELDRDGVELALVSCPPTLGIGELAPEEAAPLQAAYHEGVEAAVAEAGGRILAFSLAAPRPGYVGTIVAAEALRDLDGLAPVLDELERLGQILFVHPGPARNGEEEPWWAAVVGYTAQMQAAYAAWLARGLSRWPDLRVVFAILAGGAPIQLERLRSRGFDVRRALAPTIYLDTASYGRRAFELCLATYGGGQLVYGTDAPVIDGRQTLEAVRSFGQAVVDAVCGDNPRELLSGTGSSSASPPIETSSRPSSQSSRR